MPTQYSGLGPFANAQDILISNSTFVSISPSLHRLFDNCPQITANNYTAISLPPNPGEAQIKIPLLQKPNPSPLFTGRKDVLGKLGKIFINRANSRPRRSCLLWGMGGIGKTQICLKFTEDMADR